jgi:hypothetical protein
MNIGENKKSAKYSKLISSYWIYRILDIENKARSLNQSRTGRAEDEHH